MINNNPYDEALEAKRSLEAKRFLDPDDSLPFDGRLDLSGDEIESLAYDEWLDYMKRYNTQHDRESIQIPPLSGEECLRIIRDGWKGGGDDMAEALTQLAPIICGCEDIGGKQRLLRYDAAEQMINFLGENLGELQIKCLIEDKQRDIKILQDMLEHPNG